jgi:hypothetical protein
MVVCWRHSAPRPQLHDHPNGVRSGNEILFSEGKVFEGVRVMLAQSNIDLIPGGELWNRTA